MLSAEGQLCRRLALPDDRYPSHLPSFEIPPDIFGSTLRHLHDAREEVPFHLLNFEPPADLFRPIPQRLHDTREEEEEEQEAFVAENKESPLVTNEHDLPWIESLPAQWDELCSLYGPDPDDGVDLSDLIDYDEQDVAADVEETNCPGKKFPKEKAKKVDDIWSRSYIKRNVEYQEKCDEIAASGDENATYPSFPLKVFPEATGLCVLRGNCYHRQYKTHDISATKPTLGYREPRLMLQIFSLRLSCSASYDSYPVSVYGIVAVRDGLEPLRNHVFNRPCRDDAFMIDQDSFTLPLCSPCRGMYLLRDAALLEVDLWLKEEGDGSSDKQLLSMYAEIEGRYELDEMLDGQIRVTFAAWSSTTCYLKRVLRL